jgi:hypothetical protein
MVSQEITEDENQELLQLNRFILYGESQPFSIYVLKIDTKEKTLDCTL